MLQSNINSSGKCSRFDRVYDACHRQTTDRQKDNAATAVGSINYYRQYDYLSLHWQTEDAYKYSTGGAVKRLPPTLK